MFERGIYEKVGPWRRKFIYWGLSRALKGAGPWTGAGAGGKKENPSPQAIDWGRGRIGAGAHWLQSPGGPITNTTPAKSS